LHEDRLLWFRVRDDKSHRVARYAYNLRFPGQYYQAETGLNQNWNRDYDPLGGGRYIESDPIGLRGDSYSTYSYSGSSPVLSWDMMGLRAYSECETTAFLQDARDQSLLDQYRNHSGLGKFDFSHNSHRNDTFVVNGFTYNASQFGNFLAGYSGAYLEGFGGYLTVRSFGVLYNVLEHGRSTDWDKSSIPFIQDGAAVGQYQRDNESPPGPKCCQQ
jgi:RHS repeat-associated protein